MGQGDPLGRWDAAPAITAQPSSTSGPHQSVACVVLPICRYRTIIAVLLSALRQLPFGWRKIMIVCLLIGRKCLATNVHLGQRQLLEALPSPSSSPLELL